MLKQCCEKNIRHYAITSILAYSLEKTIAVISRKATVSENRSKVIFKRTTTHRNRKGDNVVIE